MCPSIGSESTDLEAAPATTPPRNLRGFILIASNAACVKLQASIGVVIERRAPPVPCPWIVLTPADNSAQKAPDAASHINLLRSPFIRVSPAGICPFLAAGLIPYC
jgi:hypothetical protein